MVGKEELEPRAIKSTPLSAAMYIEEKNDKTRCPKK